MPASRLSTVQLTIVSGDQAGRTIDVDAGELVVGRGADTNLTLHDANVSRCHAAIAGNGDGTAMLRDLGSANGTFVNGERVQAVVLRGGERIQIGDTMIYVQGRDADSAATQVRPRPAAEGRPSDSAVVRALRNSSVIRSLRADSAIQRLIVAPELKRTRRLTLAALGVALAAIAGVAALLIFGGSNGVQDAVAKVERGTVLVVPERDGQPNGNGSGWVYDAGRGLVVTNAHVINDGDTFKVSVGDRLVPARVAGVAPCDDLAVLKVAETTGLESITLGSQGGLELGDTVVAVGFPQSASANADLTSTAGVVSVVKTAYAEDALDIPHYPNVIQTDAAINPGNSGGPLVDLHGRLVGVNAAGRTTSASGRAIQGQAYAIGVDRVRQVVPALASGHSSVWLGAGFRYPAEQELARQGLPSGIWIDGAVAGSPAARAGLGAEPVLLTAVNRHPTGNTLSGWCAAARGIASGQNAMLDILRQGERKAQRIRVRFG